MLDYLKLFYGWIGAGYPKLSLAVAGGIGAIAFAGIWYAVGREYRAHPRTQSVAAGQRDGGRLLPELVGELTRIEVLRERANPEVSTVYLSMFVINRGSPTALTGWEVEVEVPGRRIQISQQGLGDWSPPARLPLRGENLVARDSVVPRGGKCSGWLVFQLPTRVLIDGDIRMAHLLIERVAVRFEDVKGNQFSMSLRDRGLREVLAERTDE